MVDVGALADKAGGVLSGIGSFTGGAGGATSTATSRTGEISVGGLTFAPKNDSLTYVAIGLAGLALLVVIAKSGRRKK